MKEGKMEGRQEEIKEESIHLYSYFSNLIFFFILYLDLKNLKSDFKPLHTAEPR